MATPRITKIPAPYRSGFAKIKKLSPSDAESLRAALEKSPATDGLKGMTSAVAEQAPSLKKENVEDIVRTLYSLYVIRADADTPLARFVSELISAMRATGDESLTVSEEEENEFSGKLTKLLDIGTAVVASRVEQLKSDYAKTFHSAKILTDIRPVFDKPEQRPMVVTITHTLKIEYHEEGEHREFYIALDSDDLQQVRKVLETAEAKASSLRSLLV